MFVDSHENYTVVRPSRLDASSAADFQKTVRRQLSKKGVAIIIDLNQVESIDSIGLGAIITVLKSLQSKTKLLLCGARKNVESIFKFTGMDKALGTDNHPDLASALRALPCKPVATPQHGFSLKMLRQAVLNFMA